MLVSVADNDQSQSTSAEEEDKPSLEIQISEVIRIGTGASSMLVIKELKRAVESPDAFKYIDKGVVNYIVAAGTLAYAGRDVYADGIAKLLLAIDIKPDPEILDAVHMLHFKNHLVYINAVYFLTLVGKEPTIDNVLEVIRAMDVQPDAMIAGYVIEYCKEYTTLKYTAIDAGSNLSGSSLEVYKQLSSGVIELADTMSELVLKELDKGLRNKEVQAHMGPEILPYIGAIGNLAFSGRDMDTGNISKLLLSVGVTPREDMLKLITSLRFRNHLIYVISLYFIIICKREPSMDYLIRVVRAMDVSPDALVAGYVIAYYKMKKLAGGFKWLKI